MKYDDVILGCIYEHLYTVWTDTDSENLFESIFNEGAAIENRIQGMALKYVSGGDDNIVMKLIDIYGAIFRDIIDRFKAFNSLPTPEELINLSKDYTGKDILDVVAQLKRTK